MNRSFSFAIEEQLFVKQGEYWLANARAGIKLAGGKWDITVWGKNIFDEEYLVSAIDAGLGYVRQGHALEGFNDTYPVPI